MELILKEVKKSFGEKEVLKGASFTFEKGKIYGLLGRNGSGKTTLFNCISKEIECDEGNISFINDGEDKDSLDYSKIGYVFSSPVLPEFLTGEEFVKFFIDINKANIKELLTTDEYFNLVKFERKDRDRLIKGYSHGMKNKIQMLCYLITKPPVILLDEPLTSLDVIVAHEIKKILREMKEDRILIFSTHILQLATDLCDEIVVLNNGLLEKIDHDILLSPDFEENIVEILREEGNV